MPRRSPNHNRLLQNYLGSIKVIRYSEEESDQPPKGKEIYIIDPSRYKGGDPSLQLYKSSRTSRLDSQTPSKRYKIIWKPIIFKPFRIRQSTQHKREDKNGSEEELTENLLDDFIDYLDPKTVDEFLKSGNVIVDDKMENFMHSIVEKQEPVTRSEEIVETEDDREFEEASANEENSKESLKVVDGQGVEQQGESCQNVTEGRMQMEDGNIYETSNENIASSDNRERDSKKMEIKRKRRNAVTESRKEEYFGSLPPFFLRKANNYSSRLKQSSKEISDENLLRIEEDVENESDTKKSKGEENEASLSSERSPLSDKHGTALTALPWMERSGRRVERETAENGEKIDENTNVEKVRFKNRHVRSCFSSFFLNLHNTRISSFSSYNHPNCNIWTNLRAQRFRYSVKSTTSKNR